MCTCPAQVRPTPTPPRSQHAHGGDTLCPASAWASAFTALLLSHTDVSWTHAGGTCSWDRRQSPRDVDRTRCSRTHEVGITACPGDPARPRLHLRAVRGVTPTLGPAQPGSRRQSSHPAQRSCVTCPHTSESLPALCPGHTSPAPFRFLCHPGCAPTLGPLYWRCSQPGMLTPSLPP